MKFDAIIIGAGPAGMAKATELQKQGRECAIVAKGRSLYGYEPEEFLKAGGTILMGDYVIKADIVGSKVVSITTANLGEVTLEASEYYLATGKYFAGGLTAGYDKISEPIFGLDVDYEPERSKWFDKDFAAHQNFMDFGVKLSPDGCAMIDGQAITNLFPIGEIVSGRI